MDDPENIEMLNDLKVFNNVFIFLFELSNENILRIVVSCRNSCS